MLYTLPATLREIGYLSLAILRGAQTPAQHQAVPGNRGSGSHQNAVTSAANVPTTPCAPIHVSECMSTTTGQKLLTACSMRQGVQGHKPCGLHQAQHPASTCRKQQKHRTQYAPRQVTFSGAHIFAFNSYCCFLFSTSFPNGFFLCC